MRLQLERIQYDSKESTITLDAVREQNAELTTEIEDLRVCLASVSRHKTDLVIAHDQ